MKLTLKIESRTLITILFTVALLSTVLTAFYSFRLNNMLDENADLQENRTQSILLADEMRQSSDDLTNFARLYVTTKDDYYKNAYNTVIDIRNGTKIRPHMYEGIYWDLVNAGLPINGGLGEEPKSIEERMKILGFDEVEFSLIEKSKSNSDDLVEIERKAFALIDSPNCSTAEWLKAQTTLFSHDYLVAKAKIMLPIREFYNHVNLRTTQGLIESNEQSRHYLIISVIMAIITFFLIGFLRYAIYVSKKNNDVLIANINKKNTYLEHAAKIIRHDMHSGINTYIPRGISSLNRRLKTMLDESEVKKISSPMKMLTEGLSHTQKVYQSVYAFTNLVKKDASLEKEECNIKEILNEFLSSTSYKKQVDLNDNLPTNIMVNKWLFCTAIDNLIRNGLKYNDSERKIVSIYVEDMNLIVEDNGRGMSQREFERLSLPYERKEGQVEGGTGLGLNICVAILEVHGFNVRCEGNVNKGTKIIIECQKC